MFFKSWKTTVMGLCSFIIGGLVYNGVLSVEQGNAMLFVIIGILGMVAKDGNRTGV